jgi:hypothetical protein
VVPAFARPGAAPQGRDPRHRHRDLRRQPRPSSVHRRRVRAPGGHVDVHGRRRGAGRHLAAGDGWQDAADRAHRAVTTRGDGRFRGGGPRGAWPGQLRHPVHSHALPADREASQNELVQRPAASWRRSRASGASSSSPSTTWRRGRRLGLPTRSGPELGELDRIGRRIVERLSAIPASSTSTPTSTSSSRSCSSRSTARGPRPRPRRGHNLRDRHC